MHKEFRTQLVELLTAAIADELEAVKQDIRKITENGNNVCKTKTKIVCGKEFEEDELLENFNACYAQLKRSSMVPASKKVRAARFCKAAASELGLKNKEKVAAICDRILKLAES